MLQISFGVILSFVATLFAIVNGLATLPGSIRTLRKEMSRLSKLTRKSAVLLRNVGLPLATTAILIAGAVYFLRSTVVINGRTNLGVVGTYHYSIDWQGRTIDVIPVSPTTLPRDAAFIGEASSFFTDDANFTCLNGSSLSIFASPENRHNDFLIGV
jgi:hypothetical protein